MTDPINLASALPGGLTDTASPDAQTFPGKLRGNAAFLRSCYGDLGEAEANVVITNLNVSADRIEALERVLDDALDYLAPYEDVRDGSDGRQLPNAAMSLATDIRDVIAKARGIPS